MNALVALRNLLKAARIRVPIRAATPSAASLTTPRTRGAYWNILEPFPGAWQRNVEIDRETVAAYWAVFSCVTLIAGDIAKLPPRVMQYDPKRQIWFPNRLRAPLLTKPNAYQTTIEFLFAWIASELLTGNTYVLKQRDENGFIAALYILDPYRVQPLIGADGSVYYKLMPELLAEVPDGIIVPASEIIHDRMYTLAHPLVGVSPIYACGIGAMQGAAIQQNSAKFFQNMSRPSGILTAPGEIADETAARLKEHWQKEFSGPNVGRVAVLGDNLSYSAIGMNAEDSQLIEQLKMTGEMVCACFHVPGYKIGVGTMPTVNNTAALNQQYYDQCLQYPIEKLEARLTEGLELTGSEVWLDLSNLLRMDPDARRKSHSEAVKGGWFMPNEARREENLAPVEGGDTPYMQQQNYSLAALNERDTSGDPFGQAKPPAGQAPTAPVGDGSPNPPGEDDEKNEDEAKAAQAALLGRRFLQTYRQGAHS